MAVISGGDVGFQDTLGWVCKHTDNKDSTHDTLDSASSYCATEPTCTGCSQGEI